MSNEAADFHDIEFINPTARDHPSTYDAADQSGILAVHGAAVDFEEAHGDGNVWDNFDNTVADPWQTCDGYTGPLVQANLSKMSWEVFRRNMDNRPGRAGGEEGGELPTDGTKPTIGGSSRSSASAAEAPQHQSVVLAGGVDDSVQLGVPASGAVGEGTTSTPPGEGDVNFH